MDYKQDFKDGLVERWMDCDMPMIAFLTSNPDNEIPLVTFQNWVKNYIKESAEKVTELRKANNDLQKIIDGHEKLKLLKSTYDILQNEGVYSDEGLLAHFEEYNTEKQNKIDVVNDNIKLHGENIHLKRNEIDKTDCEPIIDNSYTGQIARLTAENAQLKRDVSNLNCLLDYQEEARTAEPVVTLATLQDYCQAVVDAEKALRRFMEGGN